MQEHSTAWQEEFVALGYPDARPLAVGMEGAVYRLDAGWVGKVWAQRPASALRRLQRCYGSVAGWAGALQLPEIRDVLTIRSTTVTIERLLPGTPLSARATEPSATLPPPVLVALLTTLRGLAALPATASMRALPVLDEPRPLWHGRDTWPAALGGLIERRVARFGPLLRPQIVAFDAKVARLLALLAASDVPALTLIHGDLVPANILGGAASQPLAVLDFSFLSTAGDPAFDAAITASICDMYGPHARDHERQLDAAIAAEFGYDPQVITRYKAAYALITSNAYDPLGQDGHFAWCVRLLQRPAVTALLAPAEA